MRKLLTNLGVTAVLAGAAALAVWLEQPLTVWFARRGATLPLALLLLLAALMHPRLRHLLLVTLNFGVAFLALRDMLRGGHLPLPPAYDYDTLQAARSVALLLVASLSVISALAEIWNPGTVWARRCYFGAASLYFSGMGLMGVLIHLTWRSLVLLFTGITALIACVTADTLVASEMQQEDAPEPVVSDEVLQQAREAAHRAALQAKEWRETLAAVMEESETPSQPQVAPRLPL